MGSILESLSFSHANLKKHGHARSLSLFLSVFLLVFDFVCWILRIKGEIRHGFCLFWSICYWVFVRLIKIWGSVWLLRNFMRRTEYAILNSGHSVFFFPVKIWHWLTLNFHTCLFFVVFGFFRWLVTCGFEKFNWISIFDLFFRQISSFIYFVCFWCILYML